MNDVQQVKIPKIVEYMGKRVLTTSQLAECYGTSTKVISNNFTRNKDRYQSGVHFLCIAGKEKRELVNRHQFEDGSKNAEKLYLWSERGVLLHAKSLNTDKAWEVYEKLIDFYFSSGQQAYEGLRLQDGCVLASELHAYLGLSKANYQQWIERNITGNRFAVEGLDYRHVGGDEFILSRSMIKCMCMMSKSVEGERTRQEYLHRLDEYDALLKLLGIQRKESLNLEEIKNREQDPLVRLDFSKSVLNAVAAPAADFENKRLLSMKEFCMYSGLGRNKADEYARDNQLIVRIGRRVLVDKVKFDRLCEEK